MVKYLGNANLELKPQYCQKQTRKQQQKNRFLILKSIEVIRKYTATQCKYQPNISEVIWLSQ
jgi:hypothetical protein